MRLLLTGFEPFGGSHINPSRKAGVRRIWLRATSMGKPVYERFGFQPMESAMQLKLE